MNVIKIGGAHGLDLDEVCADLARQTEPTVLVHGGSDETNRLSEALGQPPEFVTSPSGHVSRRTDRRTVETFAMATALVNRKLVERLQANGVNAMGLSGIDAALLRAKRKAAIRIVENGRQRILRDEWTGKPQKSDAELLQLLLSRGILPVIAPLALGENGEMLNVDGDRAAATIASDLGADTLLILSNVPGLLREFPDESSLIAKIPADELERAMEFAEGRMRKKMLGAQEALQGGVPRVILSDGRVPEAITRSLTGAGTHIGALPGEERPSERLREGEAS